MNKYKVQLHCHSKSDPEDWLFHSDKELIDRAASHNYDVLAITLHNKVHFSDELKDYAYKKNILLIPGIEKTVEGNHVLIINAKKECEQIRTFNDLKEYKEKNPDCLIIAPHPYHPPPISLVSLKKNLDKNIHLFDAIEWSSFYTKSFKLNKKAVIKAKDFNLPLIATSDNHVLYFLNHTFSYVHAKQRTIPDIISSVKQGRVDIETKPMHGIRLFLMTLRLTSLEYIRRFLRFFGLFR